MYPELVAGHWKRDRFIVGSADDPKCELYIDVGVSDGSSGYKGRYFVDINGNYFGVEQTDNYFLKVNYFSDLTTDVIVQIFNEFNANGCPFSGEDDIDPSLGHIIRE